MRDLAVIAAVCVVFVCWLAFYLAVIAGVVWVAVLVLQHMGVLPA